MSRFVRTKEQRQKEVLPIIAKLTEMHLKVVQFDALKVLMRELQRYVQEGVTIDINIPFPEMNVVILGVLETNVRKRVWVKLQSNQNQDI
jgi:hypothetical protein